MMTRCGVLEPALIREAEILRHPEVVAAVASAVNEAVTELKGAFRRVMVGTDVLCRCFTCFYNMFCFCLVKSSSQRSCFLLCILLFYLITHEYIYIHSVRTSQNL